MYFTSRQKALGRRHICINQYININRVKKILIMIWWKYIITYCCRERRSCNHDCPLSDLCTTLLSPAHPWSSFSILQRPQHCKYFEHSKTKPGSPTNLLLEASGHKSYSGYYHKWNHQMSRWSTLRKSKGNVRRWDDNFFLLFYTPSSTPKT